MRKTVLIVKSALEHFRIPFYSRLAKAFEADGVDLRVLVPPDALAKHQPLPEESPAGLFVPVGTRRFQFGARRLTYQTIGRSADSADLVIVQQSAAELTNYLLFARRTWKRYRLAFWGHGHNFQESLRSRPGECLKKSLSKRVDYWFAYNHVSADIVRRLPYPAERICVVNNSIDTEGARAQWNSITPQETAETRRSLGIPADHPVVVYCGAFYKAKMLDFLVESVTRARRTQPLHLVVIGDGPGNRILLDFEKQNAEWVHLVGARYGRDKARYFRLANLCLLPGAVGLAIVDAMAYETPLLTTRSRDHGPEIGYLEQGENGWMTDCSIEDYADAIGLLLRDHDTRGRLAQGCRRTATQITLANMVERFRQGVRSALQMPPLGISAEADAAFCEQQ